MKYIITRHEFGRVCDKLTDIIQASSRSELEYENLYSVCDLFRLYVNSACLYNKLDRVVVKDYLKGVLNEF